VAEFSAFGTILKRGDGGGPEVFATVGQVRSFGGPTLSLDTIDVTSHDSAGGWREFIASLLDAGEVTLEIIWDPDMTTHVGLRTDMTSKIRRNFQLIFPDATATQWDFPAYVTGMSPTAEVDGALVATITLKSGTPTLLG
jgi:predicted secreted protein